MNGLSQVIDLRWKRSSGADHYLFKYKNEGDLYFKWLTLDEGLKPGRYKMTVRTTIKGFRDSPKIAKEFVIKPEENELAY